MMIKFHFADIKYWIDTRERVFHSIIGPGNGIFSDNS